MKKRLRKKMRVGEFRELGFTVEGRLRPGTDDAAFHAFLDRLIQRVEAEGLAFAGGGIPSHFEGVITLGRRGSATDAHRERVGALLAKDEAVAEHKVGPLQDAWHTAG